MQWIRLIWNPRMANATPQGQKVTKDIARRLADVCVLFNHQSPLLKLQNVQSDDDFESCILNNAERSGLGIFYLTIQVFRGGTRESHDNSQSVYQASELRLINRTANHYNVRCLLVRSFRHILQPLHTTPEAAIRSHGTRSLPFKHLPNHRTTEPEQRFSGLNNPSS